VQLALHALLARHVLHRRVLRRTPRVARQREVGPRSKFHGSSKLRHMIAFSQE
jgi:hypothetical protein